MIPIKITKEKLNHSFKNLEYKYLVEIPQESKDNFENYSKEYNDNQEIEDLKLFTENKFSLFRYLGLIGETNLFFCENNLYKASVDKDFLIYDGSYRSGELGFIVDDTVLKDMVGKKFECDWQSSGYIYNILTDFENVEISVDNFIQKFNACVIKDEERKQKEEEERAKKRIEEIKGNAEEITAFSKGDWKISSSGVYGKRKMIYSNGNSYTFNKDINKIFTIEELNNAYSNYDSYGIEKLNWIEILSINKRVGYKFLSSNKKRNYIVNFKNDKLFVDGLSVPISRYVFFISRANGDLEHLKRFKNMSAVKIAFLELKDISLYLGGYSYTVPIEVKSVDNIFEITLLDKTVSLGWENLEMFRYNIQSLKTNFDVDGFEEIKGLFNINKVDMFDYMKKIQLLDKLGEEN